MISSNSLCLVMLILTATNRIGSLYGLTCPGPVEEGSTVSLTCSTESTTTALVWQLEVSGQFKEVSRCQVTQDCTNLMAPAFSATLDPSATKNTQYDSVLTISRVSRNQTKFRCLNEICQLEVYVKPAKPQCVGDGAILGHRGLPYRSYLEILCSTASSYPRAKCTLNSTLSSQLVTRALPIYTYTPLGDGNYMTLCTYTMFLGGFQTGHYYFTLIMASDLSTFVPNAATAVEPQFTLTLFAPSLTLGQDCPEGNIKSGMSATCTCKMTHPGYPQGWVKWYTSSNRTTGSTSGDDFTTIALTYNPQNPCPTYECSPESALGRLTPGLSYAPSFEENAGGCPINKVIPTSQENPSDLIIGISVTVGCVLLALILGFLVFICKKKSTEPSTTSPTDVNHFPSSQSISSRDSGFSRKSDFTSITDLSSESRVSPSLPSTGPRVDSLPSALRPIDPVVSRVRPDDDSRAHGAPSVRPGDVNVRPPFDVRMGPYDDIEGPDYNTINSESTARSDIYQGSNPCSTRSVAGECPCYTSAQEWVWVRYITV